MVTALSSTIRSQDQDNDIAPVKTSSEDGAFSNGEGAKFFLSFDNEGGQLSEAQQDYFKDSRVVGENGNLKIMDHGSDRFAKGNRHSKNAPLSEDKSAFFVAKERPNGA